MVKKVEQAKIAVFTTFANRHYEEYAKAMVKSYMDNWPIEVDLYVNLEAGPETQEIVQKIEGAAQKRGVQARIAEGFGEDFKQFFERNAAKEHPTNYRQQAIRFAHKVYALNLFIDGTQDEYDYLIWMDADVITHKPVSKTEIALFTKPNVIASYLGRKDWNCSETGFIMFNLKNGGREFIRKWKQLYDTDKIFEFDEQTDAYAFDRVREEFESENKRKKVFYNLSENATGMNVFEQTILGDYMQHFKGNLKSQIAPPAPKVTNQNVFHEEHMSGKAFDVNNLGIQTKNCVQDSTIADNVAKNMKVIDKWVEMLAENDDPIVICSAGPSLDPLEVKKLYNKGYKVVAVKHALEKLKEHGIKPWACILLDPRGHVGNFVEYPDTDVIYFVASMVDPKVTTHLKKCGCTVIGYHARVGAGEESSIPLEHKRGKHIIVEGGSATATRGISLLEVLGYRTFHLFGYDCCYYKKPDLQERKDNGRLRYQEVTLSVETWGGIDERTFWTEGQFLAQVQEMKLLYFPKDHLELNIYGNGIIPWMWSNMKKNELWKDEQGKKADNMQIDQTFDQWIVDINEDNG